MSEIEQDGAASHDQTHEQSLLDADSRRYRAMLEQDYETLEKLLGDKLIYTHSDGRSDTKSQYMSRLLAGKVRYTDAVISDVEINVYEGCAVMKGRVVLRVARDTGDVELNNMFLSVWVNMSDQWKMVAWASTANKQPASN